MVEHPNFSQEDFTPQPLPWILYVCPVATVKEPPEELGVIIDVQEKILDLLRKRYPACHLAFHQDALPFDQTYGGLQYMCRLEENMVEYAYEIYLHISLNVQHIKDSELHVIGGESGAYLALKTIAFFIKHGHIFNYDMKGFDLKWAEFLASGETYAEENDRSKLVGDVVLICPSLPKPCGLARIFWKFMQPPFYNHRRLMPMGKSTVIVSIEKPTAHLVEVDLAGVEIVSSHAESARGPDFFRISAITVGNGAFHSE